MPEIGGAGGPTSGTSTKPLRAFTKTQLAALLSQSTAPALANPLPESRMALPRDRALPSSKSVACRIQLAFADSTLGAFANSTR